MCRVEFGTLCFAKADVSATHREQGFSVWSCEGDVGIVFVRVNVKVVRRVLDGITGLDNLVKTEGHGRRVTICVSRGPG